MNILVMNGFGLKTEFKSLESNGPNVMVIVSLTLLYLYATNQAHRIFILFYYYLVVGSNYLVNEPSLYFLV